MPSTSHASLALGARRIVLRRASTMSASASASSPAPSPRAAASGGLRRERAPRPRPRRRGGRARSRGSRRSRAAARRARAAPSAATGHGRAARSRRARRGRRGPAPRATRTSASAGSASAARTSEPSSPSQVGTIGTVKSRRGDVEAERRGGAACSVDPVLADEAQRPGPRRGERPRRGAVDLARVRGRVDLAGEDDVGARPAPARATATASRRFAGPSAPGLARRPDRAGEDDGRVVRGVHRVAQHRELLERVGPGGHDDAVARPRPPRPPRGRSRARQPSESWTPGSERTVRTSSTARPGTAATSAAASSVGAAPLPG